jgi:hypothetical protein
MFPESRAFGSIDIDPSKGEERFKPIFDAVKQRGEYARQIKDFYRSGRLPLAVAAKLGGSSGFEFWDALVGDRDIQFNVVPGRPEDYADAVRLLKAGPKRFVVDPITVYGLVRLRIAETVRAACGDLGVTQTTIDLLRRVLYEREQGRGRQQGIMGWDGEHYRMIDLGPDAIEARIIEIQEVLHFAESLTLVPAEAPGGIRDEAKELFEDLDPAYLDTILAAQGNDRILFCDDAPFRALAGAVIAIRSVWTQAMLLDGLREKAIAADDYFRAGNALAEFGYFFTSINVGNFTLALCEADWSLSPAIRALIDLVARPPNAPQGVINVLGELMQTGWAEKPSIDAYENLFAAIFAAFKKAQPQTDPQMLANAAFAKVRQALLRPYRGVFRRKLLKSTYLTPVNTVSAEAWRAPERIAKQIMEALGRALGRAAWVTSQE